VGSGPAEAEVAAAARQANAKLGEKRVVLTGEIPDPRWAYAVSDVVLGMGGSALRGMAMGKPLIVQGERGFWKTLKNETVDYFLWHGWYGVGAGPEYGEESLFNELGPLIEDRSLREQLGRYSLSVVQDRFSLEAAALRQIEYYRQVLNYRPLGGTSRLSTLQGACGLVGYEMERLKQRLRGTAANDDFNATPVVGRSLPVGGVHR